MNRINNKGNTVAVGAFVMLFIGAIVAVALFQSSAQNITTVVNTGFVRNQTVTMPANNGVLTLQGQAATSVVVLNSTSGAVVPATNYTIYNYVLSNGQLISQLNASATGSGYNSTSVNISYVSEPYGYATDSGTRSLVSLITILSALAIAAYVIGKALEGGMDAFN